MHEHFLFLDPTRRAYGTPRDPVVGRGTPSFFPLVLHAFDLSIWVPLALRFLRRPNTKFLAIYATTRYAPPVKKFWLRHCFCTAKSVTATAMARTFFRGENYTECKNGRLADRVRAPAGYFERGYISRRAGSSVSQRLSGAEPRRG